MAKTGVIETLVATDGLSIKCAGEYIDIKLADLSPEIITAAALHGLKQKICDAAAISRNPDTGLSATNSEKYDAMAAVADRLKSGLWNAVRGDGSGAGSQSLLFRALSRLYPAKTADELRAYIERLDKKQQAALRKNPRVASIIVELQAASGSDDSDDLLADLEAD